MTFKVIDKTTGETPDIHKLAFTEEWAMSLAHYDVQGFLLDEDGHLYLCDDCGCFVQCPLDRFETVSLDE